MNMRKRLLKRIIQGCKQCLWNHAHLLETRHMFMEFWSKLVKPWIFGGGIMSNVYETFEQC